ncbi:hypothetical protein FNV43_RR17700 [Rhamnella rubrinervis]|uniref:FAF domain-containing protein n=1 Tax=Rhamnella rubrinervis TaxID=2594499 RepID=A0A8K0GS60_9ROSA|nr:hypothetical protein FNV43_RR17700 [Rhamnella rubrinervis]
MATCGSLQHLFENPLPENPSTTLLESLSSWKNQIKPIDHNSNSFTEIFGELHFNENNNNNSVTTSSSSSSFSSSSSSSYSSLEKKNKSPSSVIKEACNFTMNGDTKLYSDHGRRHRSSDSFSSMMNTESLQLCTEGLGFESSGEVEDLINNNNDDDNDHKVIDKKDVKEDLVGFGKELMLMSRSSSSSSSSSRIFPPPISCISKNGKPWVCFKSYRHDGRFVLKEIRIPTQEFLHACREDGRLKLHFVHPNLDEEDDDENDEEYDEDY